MSNPDGRKIALVLTHERIARQQEMEILLAMLDRMAAVLVDHGLMPPHGLREAMENALPVEGEKSKVDKDFIAMLRRRYP